MEFDVNALMDRVTLGAALLGLYLVIFFVANLIYSFKAGYKVKEEIVDKNNAAAGLSFAGYLLAISIIFIGSTYGPSKGLLEDVMAVALYAVLGIVLLYVAHLVNDFVILHKFKNKKEIVEDQNIGTGAVQAGSYVASGLIVAGSIQGEGGGIHTAVAFFALGQVALLIMAKLYNLITSFDVHDQIEQDNAAAGIAFAGVLVGLGALLAKASSGNFISWQHNLAVFASVAVLACVLLPLFRVILDRVVIPNGNLNQEIEEDKSTGAGVLEFCTVVGFSAVLCFLI